MTRRVIRWPLCAVWFVAAVWSTTVGARQLSESTRDRAVGLNGGFEVVRDGLPLNWLVYTPRTVRDANFRVTVDTDAHHGERAVKFEVTRCASTGGRLSPGLAQEMAATPGATYEVTIWMKNLGADVLVRVDGVTASRRDPGPVRRTSTRHDEWVAHTLTYRVPAKMSRLRVEMNVVGPGTVWFDDVTVIKIAK